MVCKLSVLDRGVNPFVVDYDGTTPFQNHGLGHLSNIPPKKWLVQTLQIHAEIAKIYHEN